MTSHHKKKIIWSVALVAVALLSFFVFARFFSSDKVLKGTYNYLDTKKNQVIGINGAVIGTAVLFSAIPGNIDTAIVSALTGLQKPCFTVLAAVFAERHLAGILSNISFACIIPLACIFGVISVWTNGSALKKLAIKLTIMGLVLSLTIPASVVLSKHVEKISSADEKIAEVQSMDDEAAESSDSTKDKSGLSAMLNKIADAADDVKDKLEDPKGALTEVQEKVKNWINGVIEALVIMIITSCVIPILVFIFLFWILRMLFQIDLPAISRHTTSLLSKSKQNSQIG